MEIKTIARPYAKAAFVFASEANKLAEWSDMLGALAIAASDEKVEIYLNNPTVSRDHRLKFLFEMVGSYLDESGQNLVGIVATQGRLSLLPEIYRQYEQLKANLENVKDITVTSAFPLSDEDQSSLTQRLSKQFSSNIKLEIKIDNSLIGGVIIKSDDVVIDDSIKGRIRKLAESFDV